MYGSIALNGQFEIPRRLTVPLDGFTVSLDDLFEDDSEQLAFRGVLAPPVTPEVLTSFSVDSYWAPVYSGRLSGMFWAQSVAWIPPGSGTNSSWDSTTFWLPQLWDGSSAFYSQPSLWGSPDVLWLPVRPKFVDLVRGWAEAEVVEKACRQFLDDLQRRANERGRSRLAEGKRKLLLLPCRARRRSMHRPCARRALRRSSKESPDVEASWIPVVSGCRPTTGSTTSA